MTTTESLTRTQSILSSTAMNFNTIHFSKQILSEKNKQKEDPAVKVRNLTFGYKKNTTIINNINITVPAGKSLIYIWSTLKIILNAFIYEYNNSVYNIIVYFKQLLNKDSDLHNI